ncbi:MAG: acetyl-CoA carboxylase biotin carboxyl carrier protein subunit [Gudongella sp.]|nr:acetyl-CoA carboxylase biotin carboxyl carrier protein subunit [Gudongella sp.]
MRKFIINVNNKSYDVEVEEVGEVVSTAPKKVASTVSKATSAPTPKAAPKAAAAAVEASAGQEIVDSPMPGNIWKILVKEGQQVKENEVLLILEAMKMENEIVSPKDGVVSSILTQEGAAVNTGDKLVLID